ncbi:hypothetical protein CHX26_00600 [Porphyrobacter sp. HT-58-2]|uniref:hypothetical protein n=1 Tax=Porphyrobacter sp. HT-58-2 TaxID=2023229 RepID=UPI000CDC2118|nr:hypothetical protein [Porphyrobacter sp. HT-58-2]AUX68209.1 hypothetical protein CHX26_00600 [Porphyrobacter sp. HT-58-2]
MNPSVDDRLGSVLRALQTVVLPALPESASLAREQVMLAMGHIQIIQAQRDATPAFEEGELADIRAMAAAVLALDEAPATCAAERAALAQALADDTAPTRTASEAIRTAIDALLVAAREAGAREYHAALAATILPLGRARARKDREWFAIMGFDIELSGG